ncbi:hypothetical protein NEF87_001809 [Candidatus Lokiarchaeum ossiferum]|uniref:DNA methylase N-4/N-6 domain-containing protein n=1 Tax=Candidatus Lokiarchaeum ossiferum TaxID=2951803 RepID=A0ABY6HSS5_9ARCH|nr:hypothetical protein NEF87_001809 [Candidatus Lokiarchaeum sp. B-35]
MNFSFPKIDPETPVISWQDKPQTSFSVPEAKLNSINFFDSKKILSNLKMILGKEKFENEFETTKYIKFLGDEDEVWHNRIIHGDSLIGMNALLKAGYGSKVQMIYMDPPFGINFDAKHTSGSSQSEGYLDTWKNGLSSYLAYLRVRFVLFRELLTSSGSIFVQIGEKNLHYVRCLLDEIFGIENCVSQITFRTAISTNKVQGIADYLLWYAKDKKQVFRRNLFTERPMDKIAKTFTYSSKNPKNGEIIRFKPQELVKRINPLKPNRFERQFIIEYQGKKIASPNGFEWRWEKTAIQKLIELDRVQIINNKLYGKRYESDFPAMILTNLWTDTSTSTFAAKKHYTVHTNPKVIQRCMAMTTRPGDLVLDPTSGSGTTAMVAEKLERKWIVFDTSPTAILSTCNWLIGTIFPCFKWNIESNDFHYTPVNKISLSDLAHERKSKDQVRYELPLQHKKKDRVVSPFSVEEVNFKSIDRWDEHIHQILNQNGFFLSDGDNVKITNLEDITDFDGSSSEIAFQDFKLSKKIRLMQGDINNISHFVLMLSPSLDLIEENSISKIQAILHLLIKIKNIIIISHSILPDFIYKLTSKLMNGSSTNQHLKSKFCVLFAISHSDLVVDGLEFSNHKESIKILGDISYNPSTRKFSFSYFNFKNGKKLPLSVDKLAFWGFRPHKFKVPELSNNPKNFKWVQLPFYSKYIHLKLKNMYCAKENLKLIGDMLSDPKSNVDVWELCGIDFLGTFHYGFFSAKPKSMGF